MPIPASVKASLVAYVDSRIPTGDFLRAVLSNDLSGAVNRADADNSPHLVAITKYVYWQLPADCWGSERKVDLWLKSICPDCECALAHSMGVDWCPKCDPDSEY